ncbi:MAG: UDP-N-acetylglucosamine 2-epimerase (non-hydrolyzing), partial [Bdellovibrionales bacterium]|nr:UDP-N-acetylglucosamine 2-epimerase (non-hydrolyzing) [Bdellovibrionales bacterium]
MKKRIAVIFGTRPELIKVAPLFSVYKKVESQEWPIEFIPVCTGQHKELLNGLIDLFEIQNTIYLDVPNNKPNLTALTSAILSEFSNSIIQNGSVDGVIVQGDTTTTMVASLYAFYNKIPVFHIEAGLRTNNIFSPYPEEGNRRIVSQLGQLHFCPTEEAMANLLHENFNPRNLFVTGNTVIDSLDWVLKNKINDGYYKSVLPGEAPELHEVLENVGRSPVVLVTMHRRENQGDVLHGVFEVFADITKKYKEVHFIYPVHKNPNVVSVANEWLT